MAFFWCFHCWLGFVYWEALQTKIEYGSLLGGSSHDLDLFLVGCLLLLCIKNLSSDPMIFVHPKFQEATKTCFNPAWWKLKDDESQIDGSDLWICFRWFFCYTDSIPWDSSPWIRPSLEGDDVFVTFFQAWNKQIQVARWWLKKTRFLPGGFKYFLFSPLLGEVILFD